MNELKPELRSTIQVPVRLNGAFGRGLSRLSGASAPSGNTSGVLCCCFACARAPVAIVARPTATTAAPNANFVLSFVIWDPFQVARRLALPDYNRLRVKLRVSLVLDNRPNRS